MSRLFFKNRGLRRAVKHACKADDHQMPYGYDTHDGQGRVGLLLVKDDGIYVMSNGVPHDKVGKGPRCHVVYANGYDPRRGDVWDKCRAAVGGDDFVEFIELEDKLLNAILDDDADLVIQVFDNEFSVATVAKVPA